MSTLPVSAGKNRQDSPLYTAAKGSSTYRSLSAEAFVPKLHATRFPSMFCLTISATTKETGERVVAICNCL